jgi:hypothetical protein
VKLDHDAFGGCRDRRPAFAIHAKNTELEAISAEYLSRHGSRHVGLTREYSHDSNVDRKRLQEILRRISDNVHRSPYLQGKTAADEQSRPLFSQYRAALAR